MSATEGTVRETERGGRTPAPPRPDWYARRPFLVLLLVLVGVATWLLSPQTFPSAGGYSTGWEDPLAADETVLLDLGGGGDRDVALLQVRPRVSEGPSEAVRVAVCDRTSQIGMVTGPLPDSCTWVDERPRLRQGAVDPEDDEHLVLVVDPVPGATVVVDGVDVAYRDGFRVGYQHVGGHHTVPFAPAE